jgi:hypothetical protein
MYDAHSKMLTFYKRHVRLSDDDKVKLCEYRDKNIEKLKEGLKKLGYETPIRVIGQGSYSMHTIIQHPDNDYDIDNAVIFDKDALPSDPLAARQRVLKGVEKGGGNFKFNYPPEARTNAVTIWYAEGHHIDLPVFRSYQGPFGNEIIEHAGVNWTPRDPSGITEWFGNQVSTKSPSGNSANVEDGQLRRIVRLTKMFSKSRPSWNMPGGLLITVLVAECYRPDWNRDDVALYNTMSAMRTRLQFNTEILNPVDLSQKLTYKTEYVNKVVCLWEKLGNALGWLDDRLFAADCDEIKAYQAWNDVFRHKYWSELVSGAELQKSQKYVTSAGGLYVAKPTERAIESPPHRFFGD